MVGLSDAEAPPDTLSRSFYNVYFSRDAQTAQREARTMN